MGQRQMQGPRMPWGSWRVGGAKGMEGRGVTGSQESQGGARVTRVLQILTTQKQKHIARSKDHNE